MIDAAVGFFLIRLEVTTEVSGALLPPSRFRTRTVRLFLEPLQLVLLCIFPTPKSTANVDISLNGTLKANLSV